MQGRKKSGELGEDSGNTEEEDGKAGGRVMAMDNGSGIECFRYVVLCCVVGERRENDQEDKETMMSLLSLSC